MKTIIGTRVELNEHGNYAWPCPCSAWNQPAAAACWRCWKPPQPDRIVFEPGDPEWMIAMQSMGSVHA